jgi:uncharacterized phiE125 gp8 family phage protein
VTSYYRLERHSVLKYRSIRRIVEPAVEPVTLAEAKSHLRIDAGFTADDAAISSLITAARIHVENVSGRTLIRSRWQIKLDHFPSWDIELPNPPIMSDAVTVTYVPSEGGQPIAFTDFRTDRDATPAVIRPQWNGLWPVARGAENDVTVTYWAGYGESASSAPVPARHCCLMLLGHWYANREAVAPGAMNPVPMSVETLLGAINWGQYR